MLGGPLEMAVLGGGGVHYSGGSTTEGCVRGGGRGVHYRGLRYGV